MEILINIAAFVLSSVIAGAVLFLHRKRNAEYETAIEILANARSSIFERPHKPLSTHEYLERREKLALELIGEQETREHSESKRRESIMS